MRPTSGLPFLLKEGMEVYFVPPVLTTPKSAVVEEISFIKDNDWFVRFAGVDERQTAEELVGRFCLVKKTDLPEDFESLLAAPLEGFAVVDEVLGLLGTVDRLVELPAQTLLAVTSDDGEVLIPIVDEFVRGVDEQGRVVSVSVPESLVDLGRKG